MKSPLTLVIASALSLTACSKNSTLDVPPSIRASVPAIPAALDRDPEPIGQLPDGTMGTLALDSAELTRKYGVLGVRYNTLRQFYNCVREQVNLGRGTEACQL